MIFTLYYMYATLLQWWRMGSLKNKLNGTLNSKNALLVCDETVIYDTKKSRSFENLLFRFDERIGCTVVPKQKLNLSQWVAFPRDYRYFPIYFRNGSSKISSPNIYILLQAVLDTYIKHSADLIQVENFGELVAWRASDHFEAILKTDLDKLTKLVHCFSQSDVDINHELKLLKIETVDLEGIPTRIKYDRKFSKETTLKYSHAPIYWRKFAEHLKEIYSKVRDSTNPKITIENGKSEDIKKVPVSEVKPIKKDGRKLEDKNTLEVGSGDYRRHKSSEHKREKNAEKHKSDLTKTDGPHKSGRSEKEHHKRETRFKEAKAGKDDTDAAELTTVKVKKEKELVKSKSANDKKQTENADVTANKEPQAIEIKDDYLRSKPEKKKSKTDLEQPIKSNDTVKAEYSRNMPKRTTSSEKKLVKSMAVSDDIDGDAKLNSENNDTTEKKSKDCTNSNGVDINRESHTNGVSLNMLTGVKPPNILVYADSLVVKDNVKAALSSTLNKEKYIIYDFPADAGQMVWTDSTILVVVCGTVSPNVTFSLLQYLLSGGQLLCLCSDLLYSVLHTFTTAEVREHELVRFTYGQWKQVKMMHHIFCYQASPAKKQFSKDSDHSNQSSGNGSSPIAPVTPSVVDIQHNGKDYTIQVQVLGTEEIWQTPSLLLATVKGGEGRAIFSQVHLEINPNQYEDDENKFAALKDSDQARMEILKDILSNHLDIDCCSNADDVEYTPAFFLGRYDLKMNLLSDCDSIKENRIECDKMTAKFLSKDESPEEATSSYMPIFIHSCPSNFSTVKYFEALETQHIGRLVIYCDLLASSQSVVSKTLTHGLVVIARQQTRAVGRSNNTWLSPLGSANFSLQFHIPLDSPLGKVLPLVQKLAMVAIVSALKTTRGCKDLEIGIKWPNDLYANASVKIGGLLTTSYIIDKMVIVNIGCGVNLDNPSPTVCINDLIRTSNEKKGTNMKTIPYELYFASVFNEMERIYNIVQNGDVDSLYDLYYKYWLHSDCRIIITKKSGESENVMIVGVDDYGFLRVRSQNGSITTVHPDGNTFDMLKGLISPKDF